ncbi:hypothetical protein H8356DRAFT_1336674 [Neocallimastix lanati (nom. inval.)]|nr:hypothetical protein H8356DRAFT_1336674 [Neocallimastix sp. JGI-2020a]
MKMFLLNPVKINVTINFSLIANEIDLEHNNIGKFLVLSYINQKWIDESHDLGYAFDELIGTLTIEKMTYLYDHINFKCWKDKSKLGTLHNGSDFYVTFDMSFEPSRFLLVIDLNKLVSTSELSSKSHNKLWYNWNKLMSLRSFNTCQNINNKDIFIYLTLKLLVQ